ncbi:hypothetical protein PF004_g22669 [Phytophthora fragariae]|uniref:Uncharacterized protein n=1 Tax=Phytophthora fragariae TaxID=53985 RepID=A0A6G0MZE0_9STRA|nr:hypothetical protein PF004_g22669 [Phytophthora fragariae]
MAVFNDVDATLLTGTVVLLPTPDAMTEGTAPYHPLFGPGSESPHASGKRPAPRGSGKSKAPSAKKQRKVPKKAIFTLNLLPRNDQDRPGKHRAGGYEPGPRSVSHRVSLVRPALLVQPDVVS